MLDNGKTLNFLETLERGKCSEGLHLEKHRNKQEGVHSVDSGDHMSVNPFLRKGLW